MKSKLRFGQPAQISAWLCNGRILKLKTKAGIGCNSQKFEKYM